MNEKLGIALWQLFLCDECIDYGELDGHHFLK